MNYIDVTLFNRYTSNHASVYQRTYLYKVDWGAPGKNIGTPASISAQIMIPFEQTLFYKSPKQWQVGKLGFWTLQIEDIIVKGIVNVQIAAVTDLYENYSLTDLKKMFELVTISSISVNNDTISQQRFTIGGS